MKTEIKEILDKFDKKLENYDLDKKFGELSVDSIGHLFPNEMIAIRDCINNLQHRIEYLERSNNRREDTIMGLRDEIVEYEDYKTRCEKAVEYINKNAYFCYKDDEEVIDRVAIQELLNMLGGDE